MENLRIDQLSFWIGFLAATLFWWLVRQARPVLSTVRQALKERVQATREGLSTSIEQRFRRDMIQICQDKHLAAPLFSIEEIAIPTRLLAPPPPVIPGEALPPESITDIAIPYLPDWPEIGGRFRVDTLTIPEAMSKGANLLITGKPGSGRSFALYDLANKIAQRHPEVGALGSLIPIVVHAGELVLKDSEKKPLDALYQVYAQQVALLVEAQLPDFLQTLFEQKLAILMVDGLDELPPNERKAVVAYLKTLQTQFPGNRYIVTSGFEDISCQETLQLHPLAIAGWNAEDKETFIHRWRELWTTQIASQSWASALPEIYDPLIIENWLLTDTDLSLPFYLTLQTWAAFSGDSQGYGEAAALEAYLHRMSAGITNARPALENLAAQAIINLTLFLQKRKASSYIAAFEVEEAEPETEEVTPESAVSEAELPAALEDEMGDLDELLAELDSLEPDGEEANLSEDKEDGEAESDKVEAGKPRGRTLLPQLTEAGLLKQYPNGSYSFVHPIVAGYLAGVNLSGSESIQKLQEQPFWTGKVLALQYAGAHKANLQTSVQQAEQMAESDPLQSALVTAGSWLVAAPQTAGWRNQLMRTLAGRLQDETLPVDLRMRWLGALALSGEEGINTLFKQLLKSPKHTVRWLAAIGCGLTKNVAVLDQLGLLVHDSSVFVSRAACLALVSIGSTPALEQLTAALLDGTEDVKRAAAEALAQHPLEGHPVLKDGAKIENVAVRRAVVYGLALVKDPWAEQLLSEIQVEDSEWVVRNAAVQIQEDKKSASLGIPKKLAPIHEISWLIGFAGERGMGISPGQSGWDLLATALKEGDDLTRLAAMHIYRQKPGEAYVAIETLLALMGGPEGEIKEAAYDTLWHLRAAGIPLVQ